MREIEGYKGDTMQLCKCGCGKKVINIKNTYLNGHNKRGVAPWNKDKTNVYSKETLKEMSKSHKDIFIGPKSSLWRGGRIQYFHERSRVLFGKDTCEHCGIGIEEYKNNNRVKKQFEMHCIDKNYPNMNKNNWKNLCSSCHVTLHKIKYKKEIKI